MAKSKIVECEFIEIKGKMPREEIVRKVIETFINNESKERGHGIKFRYPVEKLSKFDYLYIYRPAGLNKYNFDFKVEIQKVFNLNKGTHDDIKSDILNKSKENPSVFPHLLKAINVLFSCEENDVNVILNRYPKLINAFKIGADIEVLLKVLKWLFIMEDIVYWNYLGRRKLFKYILEGFDEHLY